nr:putative gag-polypeptide of LTR copia-type [Ipomoea batatas]
MQGIWGEIERRDPNPMTCAVDIATYNKLRAEQKLFQFLNAIDRQYDPIKREILRWDPLPSAEGAYAVVRKETAHQNILGAVSGTASSQQGVAAGLAVTGPSEAEGLGLISKGRRRSDQTGKTNGYPEWWNDGHKQSGKTAKLDGGRAAAAVGNNNAIISSGDVQRNTREEGGFGGMAADIRTGVIIGRGTERQGLYYVDEVTQRGTVMLAHT